MDKYGNVTDYKPLLPVQDAIAEVDIHPGILGYHVKKSMVDNVGRLIQLVKGQK